MTVEPSKSEKKQAVNIRGLMAELHVLAPRVQQLRQIIKKESWSIQGVKLPLTTEQAAILETARDEAKARIDVISRKLKGEAPE